MSARQSGGPQNRRRASPTGRLGAAGAAVVLLFWVAPPAHGQTAPPPEGGPGLGEGELRAMALPEDAAPLRIDGVLSEDIWRRAPALTGLVQREPSQGEVATERTEVRVVYDDEKLYVAVMAFDREPNAVVARILQRDKLLEPDFFGSGIQFAGDDAVAILFDPFDDDRNGVIFATNPNGAEFEALVSDEGREINIDWRGVWEVSAQRSAEGWSAEFAIPWRTLRYPDGAPDHAWGFNVFRTIRRKHEDVLWQSWQREGGGLQRVSRAGRLTGLVNLPRQGRNIEVKPFVLTGRRQEPDEQGLVVGESDLSAGFDVKTELRPGLLLDLTYNTDFAQVEVDDEQVNLTRFDLFFPEKRDFFLENSGIFQFGVPNNPFEPPLFLMFFSRRIGIGDDGEVPIMGGARLTGRVGAQTVGFLNVVTDSAFGAPRENFAVARIKRDVGGSNYLGAMLTDRRSSTDWNTGVGVDGQFTVGSAWVWQGYAARTFTRGQNAGYSFRLAYDYSGETWGSFFNHVTVSPDVETRAGFTTRTDYRKTDLYGAHTWRPESLLGLRDLSVWFGGTYASTVSEGRFQDWVAGFALNPTWRSGDGFTAFFNGSETVVDEAFSLSDSVDVPAGRYRNDHIGWFANTSSSRWISLGSNAMITRFYGGHLVSVGGTLNLAPSPQVSMSVGHTRNDVSVPGGSFVADISSLRLSYSFSTRLSTNVLVQYNSLDDAFSTNVRFNFIHRPGSDLFIVFTENRGDDRRLWTLQDRGVVMKITYLARL